ncbi:MAG: GAF domain-containing protein [Bdellovibrionota bacterium]
MSDIQQDLETNLCRIAQFGANLADAYSCFIFLPHNFPRIEKSSIPQQLELYGYHSLSTKVLHHAVIPSGTGLIGWVSKHKKSIHVSPFEHDSRTLGIYSDDEELKSFIGIPIDLSIINNNFQLAGVLACDSKKSFAFSKLQGKLLENLSLEISNSLSLICSSHIQSRSSNSWDSFIVETLEFISNLGTSASEVLRLELRGCDILESKKGTRHSSELLDQLYRLIEQSLPPHFPFIKLPNGDSVIVSDNMMSAFCENKILAMCDHLKMKQAGLDIIFHRIPLKNKVSRVSDLDKFFGNQVLTREAQTGENVYEFRLA